MRVIVFGLANLRLRTIVRLVEYRRLLKLVVLALPSVLYTESVLEVAKNPHLPYDIPVKRHVRALDELDQEARTYGPGEHIGQNTAAITYRER